MAGVNKQFTPYLSSTHQDLLRAALASNTPDHQGGSSAKLQKGPSSAIGVLQDDRYTSGSESTEGTMFVSPQGLTNSGNMDSLDLDGTPLADYLDGDASFDFEDSQLDGQQLIGDLPGDASMPNGTEKRKNSDVDGDEDDGYGDAKRKEGEDKQAKKPGRKPLTSEPTTKRKAQNRAAQRAFRERKEGHLKELETKVMELTKTADADKQENGLLRAQVERLQSELNDYRKRLSSDATRNRSPTALPSDSYQNAARGSTNSFAFDFPSFGALPGSLLFGAKPIGPSSSTQSSVSPPQPTKTVPDSRQNSLGSNSSPGTKAASSTASRSANQSAVRKTSDAAVVNNGKAPALTKSSTSSSTLDNFAGLFSPSILKTANYGTEDNDYGFPSIVASPSSLAQNVSDKGSNPNSSISQAFSASASSNTESPSQSSLSQFACGTSCNTSPESSHPSPPKDMANTYGGVNLNLNDLSDQNAFTAPANNSGIDWLAAQNGGQFDPVLFGDYRESQANIVGDGDFNNGFFNDAFPFDLNSPLNFDFTSPKPQQTPSAQQQVQQSLAPSRACLASAEKLREGVDEDGSTSSSDGTKITYPVSSTDPNMLNCNKIWNQLQENKDFQDGKFDLDSLCSELRSKARCSEVGVVVPAADVDLAFKKLRENDKKDAPSLVWQKDFVNDAFTRLGASGMNWGGMGL